MVPSGVRFLSSAVAQKLQGMMTALSAVQESQLSTLVRENEHDARPDCDDLGVENGFDEFLEFVLGEVFLERLTPGQVAIPIGLSGRWRASIEHRRNNEEFFRKFECTLQGGDAPSKSSMTLITKPRLTTLARSFC